MVTLQALVLLRLTTSPMRGRGASSGMRSGARRRLGTRCSSCSGTQKWICTASAPPGPAYLAASTTSSCCMEIQGRRGAGMATGSHKLTERVPLNLTEQELLDLSRMALLENRTVPEFLRLKVIRPFMYGTVPLLIALINEADGGPGELGGPPT